ncbi:MAG: helix-turn-helix transcriptional regulator [Clostridiales bacterium]|nr:helix-turn-helix transcriptional regulator [Clostridiales bacterium]
MDLAKIGRFLSELRKEKKITQEQLAEKLGVARRTVSRWETGSNLPDIDLLMELSDLYEVDLREILDGARKKEMLDQKTKETVLKVAEYQNDRSLRISRTVMIYSFIGLTALIVHLILECLELPDTFWAGFGMSFTLGLAIGALIFVILYMTGKLSKLCEVKRRLLGLDSEEKGAMNK